MLEFEEVSKRFGALAAVDAVSLAVPRGAFVALVGESGSGKSTLLKMANRLIEPDAGRVLVGGVGASFEFPLLIVLAVYIGVLKVATLRRFRRHAIVAIFIIAAVVTPTPDPVTQSMMAAPLYILFELAIIAGARVERHKQQAVIE